MDMTTFIDTHSHIYLDSFDEDRQAIVDRAREKGIEKIFLPAIDSTTHEAMIRLDEEFPGCRAMIGLHPCSATNSFEKELEIIENWLKMRSFIAIGEIGLDFYWDKTFTSQQYSAFHHQVKLALAWKLPIVIHSRNAIDECIEVVEQYPGIRGVFHCFSGNEDQARRIIAAGLILGIGGVVTFKNSGVDKVVEKLGLDHIILETDAPYLAPVPFRGKRNEPAYIEIIAQKLSDLLKINLEEVGKLTTQNALKLFDKA
jgi:TatD DNase family protein